MSRAFQQTWFEESPVVGILRGFDAEAVRHIVQAARKGGLRNLEITMNSPGAEALIRLAVETGGDHMNIGAGTVLNVAQLEAAVGAGATFIVTPVVNEPVITQCVTRRIPVFPGAFTPTEIAHAWELGATMVKVFPADRLGLSYIKNIKAPFPNIRLMPTGGVSLDTLDAFVRAGTAAVGVGSPLFHNERIRQKDWVWVEKQCRAFTKAWKQAAGEEAATSTEETIV